jgi:hypothetical protein
MRRVGQALQEARVGAVYLMHGTFAGTDALGLLRAVGRLAPGARAPLERLAKRLVDALVGETGNYTPEYAALFERSIADAAEGEFHIPVRLVHWTSENHHVGRADAAICLIDELNTFAEALPQGRRVMLWGHSHGGNVLALVTNLLAADADAHAAFFGAAESYYRTPVLGKVDVPVWSRVQDALQQPHHPLKSVALDIVTFGTPVRYGWDSLGYAKLLHFINHRPAEGLPPYQAPFPPRLRNMLRATHGDAIQQLGIAGSDVPPGLFAWRSRLAEGRLAGLLQSSIRRRDLVNNLSCGMRVPAEGTTLLVDYRDADGSMESQIAGHAVYTGRAWLLFHAEEICRRFYGRGSAELLD